MNEYNEKWNKISIYGFNIFVELLVLYKPYAEQKNKIQTDKTPGCAATPHESFKVGCVFNERSKDTAKQYLLVWNRVCQPATNSQPTSQPEAARHLDG